MKVYFGKSFDKKYLKLPSNIRQKAIERIALFSVHPFDPILNNHALSGEYKGYRSINITGDLRALYEPISKERAFFISIDSHSNLYK